MKRLSMSVADQEEEEERDKESIHVDDDQDRRCRFCKKIQEIDQFKLGSFTCITCVPREQHKKNSVQPHIIMVLNRRITEAIMNCVQNHDVVVNQFNKESDNMSEYVGIPIIDLCSWIHSQFTPEMSWSHGWKLGQLVSPDFFDLTDQDEQKKCFNWINLQPDVKII